MGERVSGGRERERERKVKCKEGKEREMREKKGGGSLRLVQNWCKNTKHRVHVCVCVCCYSEFSRWEQLIYSPLFRKGCVLQILDVCESDDGGGGWCYCDSVRMQWMWFYLLPLIVPSEHTADLHLSKVKVTVLNEVWLSFFRCLQFDYIISTDSQINILNLISKRRHFAHKVYRVLSRQRSLQSVTFGIYFAACIFRCLRIFAFTRLSRRQRKFSSLRKKGREKKKSKSNFWERTPTTISGKYHALLIAWLISSHRWSAVVYFQRQEQGNRIEGRVNVAKCIGVSGETPWDWATPFSKATICMSYKLVEIPLFL